MAYAQFIEKTVISTRIRLARNFAAYPFPKKMDEAQAEDIVTLVREGLKGEDAFAEYNLETMRREEAQRLQERYLISPALLRNECSAAFVSSDNTVSIMVNEEDHLREQYICNGFELYKAYERISAIDEGLSSLYDFAFDDKLGFLTACPSNLGTGMRASVMLFLPALSMRGELKALLPAIKEAGMTVRGAFGEGTKGEGYLYQVSNERTLGWSEKDILSAMTAITMNLCDHEMRSRDEMMKSQSAELRDRCLRSYGVLTHCVLLSDEEFLERTTDIRLGVVLGFMECSDMKMFEDFLKDMRPVAFRVSNGLEGMSERDCDMARADTVRRFIPEIIRLPKHQR